MDTRIVRFSPDAIDRAANLIAAGHCVAMPTETVYGLAADATNAEAVAGIYAAKGRPDFNPLIVHVPDIEAARRVAVFDAEALALANEHWPGPLTLVLPAVQPLAVSRLVTAGLPTVAVRCPAHRAMQALLHATGKPLAAPSANASGSISPTRAAHVMRSLAGRIDLIIDDGPTSQGLESTIVATAPLRLLRPGPIDLGLTLAPTGAVEAPGQLASHYAPSKPLRLNAIAAAPDEWLIGFGAVRGAATLSAVGSLTEAAAHLFDCLHQADASSLPRIAVAPVPQTGLGVAINDRLQRAAA